MKKIFQRICGDSGDYMVNVPVLLKACSAQGTHLVFVKCPFSWLTAKRHIFGILLGHVELQCGTQMTAILGCHISFEQFVLVIHLV